MRGTYCLLILVQYNSDVRYPVSIFSVAYALRGYDTRSSKNCLYFHFGTFALSFPKVFRFSTFAFHKKYF